MSGEERSARPVRQSSLQPAPPNRLVRQIRRRRSADDDDPLQICASPLARGKRGTSGKPGSDRPKVRVAWRRNDPKNERELERVEVVARQIPGRCRPSTGRSRAFAATDKPTILYSRQELAERLRLAWKHREENKANINIFLAGSIADGRCESGMSDRVANGTPSSPLRKRDDRRPEDAPFVLCCERTAERKASSNIDCAPSAIKADNSTLEVPSGEDSSTAGQKRASFRSGANRAFLELTKSPTRFGRNPAPGRAPFSRGAEDNEENPAARGSTGCRCDTAVEESAGQTGIADGRSTTPAERSARSRSTIERRRPSSDGSAAAARKTRDARKFASDRAAEGKNDPSKDDPGIREEDRDGRCGSVNGRRPARRPMENRKIDGKPWRANSAPPQRHLDGSASSSDRVRVNIVIDTSGASSGRRKETLRQKVSADRRDAAARDAETGSAKALPSRLARSAPSKRRSRSARRRFWCGSSGGNGETGKPRNRAKNPVDGRTMDIVTMVSLVSSADSDTDAENSPGDDELIDELRSKLPTVSIIKPSITSATNSARKPVKSVSFQEDTSDEDAPKEQRPSSKEERRTTEKPSSEGSPCWRTEVAGLRLPVLALIQDMGVPFDVPLTDREKRCLAVPIGDSNDKKRKVQKTRGKMEKQIISSKATAREASKVTTQKGNIIEKQARTSGDNAALNRNSGCSPPSSENVQSLKPAPVEPRLKSEKEKECWHLYRKMCDKGVCISFDTVLRGMLTPTEYRLRQKESSQDL